MEIEITHKRCHQCERMLGLADFGRSKARAFGVEKTCRTCRAENHLRSGKLGASGPKADMKRQGREKMFADQGGVCALTGEPLIGRGCLDHDHATGKSRALVTHRANVLIGSHEAGKIYSPQIAEYLERYK